MSYDWKLTGTIYTTGGGSDSGKPLNIGLKHPEVAWRGSPGKHRGSALVFKEGHVNGDAVSHGVAWGDNATGYTLNIVLKNNTIFAINFHHDNNNFYGSWTDAFLDRTGSVEGVKG
eukprot:TRINITY_DN662_c0_g1_i2.p1 TRINITY_DN662_c0_g1~~TRINITY_DN662_c0_g1_i2.p1  ORF type:complete len:116 (+),score=36.48 TRINITY_DN662_c0_g1_i2:352-699(+)